MDRRTFLKSTSIATAGAALATGFAFSGQIAQNKLSKWKGFNLLDFFSPDPK